MSRFFIFLWIYTQTVDLLGRVIGPPQGLYLNTGQHRHRLNARARARTHTRIHTQTPGIHALSGIRTHDHSVRACEDSSCLRRLSYRDWHFMFIIIIIIIIIIIVIVIVIMSM
jgi:hypothetical protein